MTDAPSEGPRQRAEVMRWRKTERKRLVARRFEIESRQRRRYAERIAAHLEDVIGEVRGSTVSMYWPMSGEPNLRAFAERLLARGASLALPVVEERGRPLAFRAWTPGERLERGVWNIPIPAEGVALSPEVVLAPVVGFDSACYRLGNGGGYFDRTLAAMSRKPRAVGVGYTNAAIPTIYPQWHDVPMDVVVTEEGPVHRPANEESPL